jgi:hypothetical protein
MSPLVAHRNLSPVADAVTDLFEKLFADLELMRAALVELFSQGPVESAAVVAAVEPDARALLDKGMVLGAGYVAARDALDDKSLYLAWWQGETRQLLGDPDTPAMSDPLDYTRREWFRTPEMSGERHVTGPYVDYVCTDEYVVTSTDPVVVDGRMVGVVGADTLVETLERMLLPILREAGATLVNDHGRTVASTDLRIAAGTIVDLSSCQEAVSCGDLPLRVVITR